MRFDVITIFPKIFDSYLNESILKRARERKIMAFYAHDLRKHTLNKYKKVDDKPYGGGAGMVFMAEPILRAVEAIRKKTGTVKRRKVVILSAKGVPFTQKHAYEWSTKYDQITLVSGRYEGIDERAATILKAEEISIGPYVLTDGDVGVMAIVSAVTRLLPGAIRLESLAEESHFNKLKRKEKNAVRESGLEYPHYTRPEVLVYKKKKYFVPNVLLSGDHKKIEEWRQRT